MLAAQAAENASSQDIAMLQECLSRMHVCVQDPEHYREEARCFMSLVATASGNRVLALVVGALHRMSEGTGVAWDEKQRQSALRRNEKVFRAIERGEPDEARSIMEKSLAVAVRSWERTAPAELKEPVAWIDSEH